MQKAVKLTKRIAAITALVLVCIFAAACAYLHPALKVGAGTVAHQMCSQTFISNLPEEMTRDQLLSKLVGPAVRLARIEVDGSAATVDVSLLFTHARAKYQNGWGCRLEFDETAETLPQLPPDQWKQAPTESSRQQTDLFAPTVPVSTDSPTLAAALEREFTDPSGSEARNVKAVVIVKGGKVVAERYAQHFSIDTPVMSFSVAKSFTNALLGILVRQGRLDMNQPIAIKQWQSPNDPRAKLRPDDLLRMASGLDAKEGDSGFDPANQMFYNRNDMAGYGASLPLKTAPATEWDYTSVNTLLLDRVIGDTIGGGPKDVRDFAERELFAPLGMKSVTMEFDGAGTFMGASHLYATPRDFARFGALYLNDGIAPDGKRILPEGWVAYSRRSTLGSTYGAGFWTNDGTSEFAANRIRQGFPKDGFFASGNLGQRIYIVPSAKLVMVRFGYSKGPDFGIVEDLRLMKTAIEDTRSGKG